MTSLIDITRGTQQCIRVPIIRTLIGSEAYVAANVIRGTRDGPTLGIFGCIHGDESATISLLHTLVTLLSPSELKGTVVVVPVANPFALAGFSRFTPEQHGIIDLHASFPGNESGCLTQRVAHCLTENILLALDAFIDVHSGGFGGRLQCRVDYDYRLSGDVRSRTVSLCREVGTPIVHENNLEGSASAFLNTRSVPTVNIEMGGAYLGQESTSYFESIGVNGILRVLRRLGIIDVAPEAATEKALLFNRANRIEVSPSVGGFLESKFQSPHDLAKIVRKGTLLGDVLDPYSLKTVETIISPVDGYLFFSRYSGLTEAGSKTFGIANAEGVEWL